MKNPRLEVFKVILSPSSEKNKDTFSFRELFISKYSLSDKATDSQIYKAFFEDVFKSSDYKENSKLRKAFRLSKNITKKGRSFITHGVIEGGAFDVGKTAGNRRTQRESRKLHKDVIIQDDFYFLLQTRLDKKVGILILQTYSQDRIDDVFKPFIKKIFKNTGKTYEAVVAPYIPKSIEDMAKTTAIVSELNYQTKNLRINQLSEDKKDKLEGKFNIKITLTPVEGSVTLPTLNKWGKTLGKILLKLPGTEMTLDSFNSKTGYLRSKTLKNPARFEIDAESIKIKPTLFLEKVDDVILEENGTPDWESLKKYCLENLLPDLEQEIYE